MKKTVIILSACVAFSACTKNVNDPETPETQSTPATFTAVTEDMGDVTKTAYENSKIKWFKNDKINVLYHTSNSVEKCEFTNQADAGTTASFSGDLVGTKVAGEPFYAVYPTTGSNYDLTAEGKVKFTVTNNTQTISQGYSFANGSNYTFASSVDDQPDGGNTLYFKNAQSLIKFTVPADLAGTENLVSVSLTPNNKEYSFIGTYTCDWDEVEPVVEFSANTEERTVTAKNNAGSGWKGGQPYYVTVPPVIYKDGIMVDVTLKDNKHIVRYNFNDFTAVRAKMHNIGTLPTTADYTKVADFTGKNMPSFITTVNSCVLDNGELKDDKSSTSNFTTGVFDVTTQKVTDNDTFNASAYNTLRFKVRYDSNMKLEGESVGDNKLLIAVQAAGKTRTLATRVNGKAQNQVDQDNPIKRDGSWNVVEIDVKTLSDEYNSLSDKKISICPFGGDLDASFNSKGTNRVCWIKDFEFIKR